MEELGTARTLKMQDFGGTDTPLHDDKFEEDHVHTDISLLCPNKFQELLAKNTLDCLIN
jgi:hypothetical protein